MDSLVELLADSVRRQREEQRRHYRREPKSARQVISRVMQQKAYAELQVSSELQTAWRNAVGEQLVQQTRIGRIRRGVLDVFVGNSVVLQELSFQKQQILSELQQNSVGEAVRDIRFHSGSMT